MTTLRKESVPQVKTPLKKTVQIILSKFLYEAVICFLIIAFVVPTLVYFLIYDMGTEPTDETATCVLQYGYRVPCGFVEGLPMGNLSSFRCGNIHCCYDSFTEQCYHYFPSKFGYHQLNNDSKVFESFTLNTPLGNPSHRNLSIEVSITENFLQADLVYKSVNSVKKKLDVESDFVYKIPSNRLGLEISRKSNTSKVILQTARGPLIASDGYWEWTIQLGPTNSSLYGLGGLHITGNLTKVLYKNSIDHSSLPLFMVNFEEKFHAVRIQHVGPLEVQVLESKLIILRSLHTKGLGLRLYPGPTIKAIRNQRLSELPPEMINPIPRWMLGSHICRNKIADLPTLLDEYIKENAKSILKPDSDCFNELLMILVIEHYKRASSNTGDALIKLKNVVAQKILNGRNFVLALSPHVPIGPDNEKHDLYLEAEEKQVLLKNNLSRIYQGEYKGRKVAILDFNAVNIKAYLTSLLEVLEHELSINVKGVYLLDNWPQDDNFNFDPVQEKLLYYNEDIIRSMNQTPSLIHNQESYVTQQIQILGSILTPLTPIFSASTFHSIFNPRLPQYVNFTWINLKESSTKHLFNNLLAHPVSHSPVCGTPQTIPDTAHANELCARWYLNSASHPGQRFTTDWLLHANFSTSSRNIAEKALKTKQLFSYYHYTNLRLTGFAIKPMFMDFPTDNETWGLEDQFMIGDLLTVQIMLPQTRMTRVYLPGNISWFEFWGGIHFENGWNTISIVKDEIVMFIKQGSIVTLLKEATAELSSYHFDLVIATNSNATENESIPGAIFFNSLELQLNANISGGYLQVENILKVQKDINCEGFPTNPRIINQVKIFDCEKPTRYHYLGFDICHSSEDHQQIQFKERMNNP